MRFVLARPVHREAHIDLVHEAADGLGLHKACAQAQHINQVFAVDVHQVPRGLAHAREADKHRHERQDFEIREPALFDIAVHARLARIESGRESGKAFRAAQRKLVAVPRVVKDVDLALDRRRKLVARVENVLAEDLPEKVPAFAVIQVEVRLSR